MSSQGRSKDPSAPAPAHLRVSVLGLDVVGKRLGLLVAVMVIVVTVVVVLGPDILHLVDAAALGASLEGALARKLQRRL